MESIVHPYVCGGGLGHIGPLPLLLCRLLAPVLCCSVLSGSVFSVFWLAWTLKPKPTTEVELLGNKNRSRSENQHFGSVLAVC